MPRFQILIYCFVCCLFAGFILLGPYPARAGSLDLFTKPGHYRVVGKITVIDKTLILTVFGHSENPVHLTVLLPKRKASRHSFLKKLLSLLNSHVSITGFISEPLKNRTGSLAAEKIAPFIPDYRRASSGDGFWHLSE